MQNDAKKLKYEQELSNEYQHDRVKMVFKKDFCILLHWAKGASVFEGLRLPYLPLPNVARNTKELSG